MEKDYTASQELTIYARPGPEQLRNIKGWEPIFIGATDSDFFGCPTFYITGLEGGKSLREFESGKIIKLPAALNKGWYWVEK